jgi:uncharacterized membrane protein
MSGAWAIVPLLPSIVGIVATVLFFAFLFSSLASAPRGTVTNSTAVGLIGAFLGALLIYYISYFIVLILVAVMIFKLASRRNAHFNRQLLLQEDLVSMARELSAKRGIDISILLNNMERNLRETRLEEAEKNATLYALLPFVWIYPAYFLMKDFFKHERREDLFINDMLRTFNALGVPVNFPYRNPPIPDRSFALYFVLTLITGSIFGVYWVYVLVTDPNNHFRQQMLMEDTIMAQLSGTPSPAPPPSPIPSAPPS